MATRPPELQPHGENRVARRRFLRAVSVHVPEALGELAELAPTLPDVLFPSNAVERQAEEPLRAWAIARGFSAPKTKRPRRLVADRR